MSLLLLCHPGLLGPGALDTISLGGVHVTHDWLPSELLRAMRADAEALHASGHFSPDGLTNAAKSRAQQGFSARADRQTFRNDAWDSAGLGDVDARVEFASRMLALRLELASGLKRPTLAEQGTRKHEMTYNWYEPGAKLGRHLDEHHEETKGTKG
jgi:alkylated DNA repair dioxygenase AlkB